MGAGRYDVVGAAGAATAMLLARQGVRVLAVDRVSFPCDTISSHQLQIPGVALLHRWGLLGKLAAAGTPRGAGAEVRENFRVTQMMGSGNRVTGFRGAARGRPAVTQTASLLMGADGRRSLVAGAVGARRYREQPVRSFASCTYWLGSRSRAGNCTSGRAARWRSFPPTASTPWSMWRHR